MSRGYPDYAIVEELGEVLLPADIAELAARLGSIVSFDRRGSVVFLDDFEAPLLKWGVSGIGANTAYLDSSMAKSGAQSIRCDLGPTSGSVVAITRAFTLLHAQRLGFEWSFGFWHVDMYLYLRLWYYDGTNKKIAGIYIYQDTGLCQYVDSDGNPQEIVTLGGLSWNDFIEHTFKVVIDFENDKYARFLIDNIEVDLSAYAIETEIDDEAPYIQAILYVYTEADGTKRAHFDDFILTKNEPPQ